MANIFISQNLFDISNPCAEVTKPGQRCRLQEPVPQGFVGSNPTLCTTVLPNLLVIHPFGNYYLKGNHFTNIAIIEIPLILRFTHFLVRKAWEMHKQVKGEGFHFEALLMVLFFVFGAIAYIGDSFSAITSMVCWCASIVSAYQVYTYKNRKRNK